MTVSSLRELKQKAKMPANQAGGGTVQAFFEANKASMAAVLPRHVTPERMLRIAMGALRTTPALMNATTESLMGAVMVCAQVGLEPNTPMGHAYLIPFNNRKANRTDVQVIFGFRGLIDLARRSGQIVSLSANVVYENDEFDFAYGINERLEHIPAENNRGAFKAVYAIANLKDGGHQFEVMYRDAIITIMQGTQSRGKYGPWKDHFDEMARKTAIRRLFKYLPVSIEIAQAVQIDEVGENAGDQHLHTIFDGEYTVQPDDYESQHEAEPEPEQSEQQNTNSDPIAQPNQETDQPPQYPEAFTDPDTKEQGWSDANGEFYDEAKHQWSRDKKQPTVNTDGTFKLKEQKA